MLKNYRFVLAVAGLTVGLALSASGASSLEDFSSPPSNSGWRVFGNPGLFSWDSESQNLQVTWDSAQTNSYFYRPLGTVLARDDDFTLEFDLRLTDIATGAKSGPFEIAIGLLNFSDATRADFWRGSGINVQHGPRNVAELAYFPAGYITGWGDVKASISPTVVSMDNGFAFAFTELELTNGAVYHVTLSFKTSSQTLSTTLTCNGTTVGEVADNVLGASFTDFRLDTLAVASYSDVGDDYSSVLAHGVVDNISITMPAPPVSNIYGSLDGNVWKTEFEGRTNWLYALERTADFTGWTAASDVVSGTNGLNVLEDRNPPAARAFYRVRAERP